MREGTLFLHPCRFRLEEEVGSAVMTYIFRPKKSQDDTHAHDPTHNMDTTNLICSKKSDKKSDGTSGDHPLTDNPVNVAINERLRNKAAMMANDRFTHKSTKDKGGDAASVLDSKTTHSSKQTHSSNHGHSHGHAGDETDTDDEDGAEMRSRAKNNFTFVSVIMWSTTFVLDYKRDDHKKHSAISMPECVDFRFDVPTIRYENKVWTAEDLVNHLKVDIIKSMWHQRSDIIKQVFHKTSIFRSKKGLRQIAGIETQNATSSLKKEQKKSGLRFKESALEPLDIDDALGPQITHDLDPRMPEVGSRSVSPTATANSRHTRGASLASDPSIYEASTQWSEDHPEGADASFESGPVPHREKDKDAASQKSHKRGLGSLVKSGIRKVKEHHHHHHDKEKNDHGASRSTSQPGSSRERSASEAAALGAAACMLDEAGAEDLTPTSDNPQGTAGAP